MCIHISLSLFTDPTLNMENLVTVIKEVATGWRLFWKEDAIAWLDASCGLWAGIGPSQLENIERSSATNEQRQVKCLETYLYTHPFPTWVRLSRALAAKDEKKALEKAQQFIQKGGLQ